MTRVRFTVLFFGCFLIFSKALASRKPSILDPHGQLSEEDRESLESEGRQLISTRKVNGKDLLIQIDFLDPHNSEDGFDEGGIKGRDNSGKSLFSLGTYSQWSFEYSSDPAVLMLFLNDGGGNYILDDLKFSDLMLDNGIPDLVRKYIRDEIMRNEISYKEIISSAFYAISEALNPEYLQKLEVNGLEMINTDKRYHRAHCVYGNCQYYEFTPEEESVVGPIIPRNAITVNGLPENKSRKLQSVIDKLTGWGYTHQSEITSNWPWIYDSSLKEYTLNGQIPESYFLVKRDNPWSVLNSSSETKEVAEELPTMAWLQIHGWKATYCNFFAQDLSYKIFGQLPWESGRVANDIHETIISSKDFFEIKSMDVYNYVNMGFMCYYTQLGGLKENQVDRWPGHIAMGWTVNNSIIQAGKETGIKDPATIFNQNDLVISLYLGFLKRKHEK